MTENATIHEARTPADWTPNDHWKQDANSPRPSKEHGDELSKDSEFLRWLAGKFEIVEPKIGDQLRSVADTVDSM